MKIRTLRDESLGHEGGYDDRQVVYLQLTPGEAINLRVALDDLLRRDEPDPGWHFHTEAWDRTREVVLSRDDDGAACEPTQEERLAAALEDHARRGSGATAAIRTAAAFFDGDLHRATEVVRQHPAWSNRL